MREKGWYYEPRIEKKKKRSILLNSMKRTMNRREISPPRVLLKKGFFLSQNANAQFTITTNLPLLSFFPYLYLTNPNQLTNPLIFYLS